jgi:hypothetical protein
MTVGVAVAVFLALGSLGELFLRAFPPKDLQPYLGDASPLTGLYLPDDEFAATYRSWDAFADDNAARLKEYLPLERAGAGRPLWAMFGNSFIHADGMLADTARTSVSDHRIFNLGRNEPLPIRCAQLRELLNHGLAPERVIFELMPLDTWGLAQSPLQSWHVTPRGAITHTPRTPAGPAGWLIGRSRLALAAWIRTNRHVADPSLQPSQLLNGLGADHLADLRRLFAGIAGACHRRNIPVTVLLIPTYDQIAKGKSFGFQDCLTPKLRDLGIDVCDPRTPFCGYADKPALFIPDKHFSPAGNAILLAELLGHFHDGSPTGTIVGRATP